MSLNSIFLLVQQLYVLSYYIYIEVYSYLIYKFKFIRIDTQLFTRLYIYIDMIYLYCHLHLSASYVDCPCMHATKHYLFDLCNEFYIYIWIYILFCVFSDHHDTNFGRTSDMSMSCHRILLTIWIMFIRHLTQFFSILSKITKYVKDQKNFNKTFIKYIWSIIN